ncbi:hypothetical protein [Brevundimonas sp.]|uniref:hypothetical protein n=1 Tax=Brevundimonas sp. TaxID=1871086 RepID=UPI003D13F235
MSRQKPRRSRRPEQDQSGDTILIIGLALLAVLQGSVVVGGVVLGIVKMFAALLRL